MNMTNKIDFAVVFRVRNANPNGDPLNGNRPRTTYDRLGEVSDVCIKRKIRNRLMTDGVSIFVQSDDNKTDQCTSLRARAEAAKMPLDNAPRLRKEACSKWYDVRAFGQLFAFSNKKKAKKTNSDSDEAAGEDSISVGIRGPVSIHSAFSLKPVEITSTQITKSVNAEDGKNKKSSDTMGMKHRVDAGLYVFYGSINPQLASLTGFSDEDAELLKNTLPKLFENDASSARPEGSMEVLKVIWWKHNCPAGQISSAKVHRSLRVSDAGDVSCNEVGGPTPEIIDGF